MILVACSKPPTAEKNQTQIANPAAKKCVADGYQYEIRTAADGSQAGYCIFPSGKECDEWAYYRGTCAND